MSEESSTGIDTFEKIKKFDENNTEYWSARELMPLLGYQEWRYFEGVIEKAKIAVINSDENVDNHFGADTQMVSTGYDTPRAVPDYRLTRYACYLIAQNGNPRYPQVAAAQTYFAIQTRRKELADVENEDMKRLEARKKLSATEKKFSGVIMDRGVDKFGVARIRAFGDKELFGGSTTQEMKNQYGLKSSKPLADVLPTVSLKAKDLATEMTTVNAVQKNLRGENPIGHEHVENNKQVRNALTQRGIKIEQLPPEEDISKVERRINAANKKMLKDDSPTGLS